MELNQLIQQFQHKHNIIFQPNGIQIGYLLLKPLDCYMPRGINRKACIHISGDEEVGKTSLALEFAYKNPDYLFIYVDTYFKLQEKDIPDNVYLFRTNRITDIIEYLNTLEPKAADFIMIDSLSNLLLPEEQSRDLGYVAQRYNSFNNSIIKIIEKCCSLNICLILFNTINGNGSPAYFSSQLRYRCSLDIKILEKIKEGNHYWLNLKAEKWGSRPSDDVDPTRSVLLTGQGDD